MLPRPDGQPCTLVLRKVFGSERARLPSAHSNNISRTRHAAASAHASASVDVRAVASNSGDASARPVEMLFGRSARTVWRYSVSEPTARAPSAAVFTGGLSGRDASGNLWSLTCRNYCRPQSPWPSPYSPWPDLGPDDSGGLRRRMDSSSCHWLGIRLLGQGHRPHKPKGSMIEHSENTGHRVLELNEIHPVLRIPQ